MNLTQQEANEKLETSIGTLKFLQARFEDRLDDSPAWSNPNTTEMIEMRYAIRNLTELIEHFRQACHEENSRGVIDLILETQEEIDDYLNPNPQPVQIS